MAPTIPTFNAFVDKRLVFECTFVEWSFVFTFNDKEDLTDNDVDDENSCNRKRKLIIVFESYERLNSKGLISLTEKIITPTNSTNVK